MKRLAINVDMDGILVDLLASWLKEINHKYGLNVTKDQVTQWDMSKCPAMAHIPEREILDLICRPGFFEEAAILPGAFWGLSTLYEMGHDVKIVTATPHSIDAQCQREKLSWLDYHFDWLNWDDDVIFASAKEKLTVGGDVLIEDRPDTLIGYADAWPTALVTGIHYPYNASIIESVIERKRKILLANDHNDTVKAWYTIVTLIEDRANRA